MSLQPGARLGAYEVLAPLGAGGMGEVFRARDTRLHRDVALKVLPEETALAEARAAAALHHPGIVAVYDVGIESGVAYLVSELVDGPTLRALLASGPMPQPKAVDLAAQIAEALAAAHAAGIVHRDLKPENVIVDRTGHPRILDFGFAQHPRRSSDETETQAITREGMIKGTIGYMSPEQVRGRPVDSRSDIFAFGVLLHEMLGGRRTFTGESSAGVLSAILKESPAELPAAISPVLRRIVARCLEKDAAQRFQSAADLAFALRTLPHEATPGHPAAAQPPRQWGLAVFAGLCAVVALATLFVRPAQQPVYDITPLTAFSGSETHPALSWDGKQLAFVWAGEPPGVPGVYVKLVAGGSQPLRVSPPDLRADYPCWSPDGSRVAYTRAEGGGASVLVAPSLGGPERRVAQFPGSAAPLDWSRDGRWIAGSVRDGEAESILLIGAESGEQHKVSAAPPNHQDRNPAFSPDGRTLVFVRVSNPYSNFVYSVGLRADGSNAGPARQISAREWNSRSVDWMPDGKHVGIASLAGSRLQFWSIPAGGGDARRLPLELANDTSSPDEAQISIRGGRMAVVQSSLALDIGRIECSGGRCREEPFYNSSRSDSEPQVSPDRRHVVFSSTRSGYREIWRADPDGSNALPLTNFQGVRVGSPRWSPDSQTIVFDAYRGGNSDIWSVGADGGVPERLTTDTSNEYRPSYSHNGQWIYFGSNRAGQEVWKMPAGGGTAEPVTHNGGYEAFASPDGKWLYYTKSGRPRDGIYRVATGGGPEELVVRDTAARAWAVAENRIYLGLNEPMSIVAVDPATHRREEVYRFREDANRWNFSTALSVSLDGRTLYHAGLRSNESDILLVENFR